MFRREVMILLTVLFLVFCSFHALHPSYVSNLTFALHKLSSFLIVLSSRILKQILTILYLVCTVCLTASSPLLFLLPQLRTKIMITVTVFYMNRIRVLWFRFSELSRRSQLFIVTSFTYSM